jgi:hypothetical protein
MNKPITTFGQARLYKGVLLVFVLNTIDAIATAVFVHKGWAREANPLMKHLLDYSTWLFITVKLVVGLLFLTVFSIAYELKITKILVCVLIAIYGLIVFLQAIIGLSVLYDFLIY